MRPSHESVKRDQDSRDEQLIKNIHGLLSDLVTAASTKSDLRIGLKVIALAKGMNVFDSSMEPYELILKGENKHKTDFTKA